METTLVFQVLTGIVVGTFLYYGMDVRRKRHSMSFVSKPWNLLMRVCSFFLLAGIGIAVAMMTATLPTDWAALALMAVGAAWVRSAKKELGQSHTWTGHFKRKTRLVTSGVYRRTRNPLYLGVFTFEIGAMVVFLAHFQPLLFESRVGTVLALGAVGLSLTYCVAFNVAMSLCEAEYLRSEFPDEYAEFETHVPFLVPRLSR